MTPTQWKIMELFAANITERYSILHMAKEIKSHYPLIYNATIKLLAQGFLKKDGNGLIFLDYRSNHASIAYAESKRKESFLKQNPIVHLFQKEALSQLREAFFILLVFGSKVKKSKTNDTDILLILENTKDIEFAQALLRRISEKYSIPFHITAISVKSAQEMLAKHDEINVMNETLNKHILLFGAENYYRILANARR